MFYNKNKVLNKRVGQLLIERGIITQGQLDKALTTQTEHADQNKTKKPVGEILIELGYTTEEEVITVVTNQYGIPYLPIENYEIDPELIKTVPRDAIHRHGFLPIDKVGDLFTIVIADISDETIPEIEKLLASKVVIFVSSPTALRKAIEKYYG